MTRGQERLLNALRDRSNSIVGVFGPTGTGKSLLSLCFAYDAVASGLYERAVYAKPVVDVVTGRELTVEELGERYEDVVKRHMQDLFTGLVDFMELEEAIRRGRLQISDTHYVRGRTFDRTFIVVDDAQNTSSEALIEIVSRLGTNSKLVIIGDPVFQVFHAGRSHILEIRGILLREKDAAVIDLGLDDIVRPGARKALKLLLELKMRRRQLTQEEEKVKKAIELIAPDANVVTVLETRSLKEKLGLDRSAPAPDFLIVVKEGHHGRAVGKGGERITRLESELNVKARVAEASLDLLAFLKALHPLSKALSAVEKVDIEGGDLVLYVPAGKAGPIIGQKGAFIRFVEIAMQQLLGLGVVVKEEAVEEREKKALPKR